MYLGLAKRSCNLSEREIGAAARWATRTRCRAGGWRQNDMGGRPAAQVAFYDHRFAGRRKHVRPPAILATSRSARGAKCEDDRVLSKQPALGRDISLARTRANSDQGFTIGQRIALLPSIHLCRGAERGRRFPMLWKRPLGQLIIWSRQMVRPYVKGAMTPPEWRLFMGTSSPGLYKRMCKPDQPLTKPLKTLSKTA